MLSTSDLAHFEASAQQAIQNQLERLGRADAAGDVEGVVGAAKDLVETVGKAVMDALGTTYPSSPDLPVVAKLTLEGLRLHPAGLQGREALQRVSGAYITALGGLAHLRNTDGTGHGRATPSELEPAHADLARDAARVWSRWVLKTSQRVLRARAELQEAISDISGYRTFRRGELPLFLADLRVRDLVDDDQHKVGLVVGRRWNVNGTFVALLDVIEPLARGEETYPEAFAAGVIEGLVIDYDGYVLIKPRGSDLIIDIAVRLTADHRRDLFERLADIVDQSDASRAFTAIDRTDAVAVLRARAAGADETVGLSLTRIAERLQALPIDST